jgi:hypothetical protein
MASLGSTLKFRINNAFLNRKKTLKNSLDEKLKEIQQESNKNPTIKNGDEIIIYIYAHGTDIFTQIPTELKTKTLITGTDPGKVICNIKDKTATAELINKLIRYPLTRVKSKLRSELIETLIKSESCMPAERINNLRVKYPQYNNPICRNPENIFIKTYTPSNEHLYQISNSDVPVMFTVLFSTEPKDRVYTASYKYTSLRKLKKDYDIKKLNDLKEFDLIESTYWSKRMGINKYTYQGEQAVVLSDLIKTLKSKGYTNIHIINMSCRTIDKGQFTNEQVQDILGQIKGNERVCNQYAKYNNDCKTSFYSNEKGKNTETETGRAEVVAAEPNDKKMGKKLPFLENIKKNHKLKKYKNSKSKNSKS